MARGGRAPDGRALSPSSAIPGARLMPAMRLRHTRRRRNPSRCPAPVCGLMQVAGPPPVGVTPAQPTSPADVIIDSPEDYCGRHHVCRGIWGGVRHPLFFWLVWQHIPGGPLHASSPASAVLARPWRCDLGRRHSGMLLPPTLSAREVGVACHLDCPRHPHRHDMQANLVIQDDPRASGGGEEGVTR